MDVRLIENKDILEKENLEESTEFINLDNNQIKKGRDEEKRPSKIFNFNSAIFVEIVTIYLLLKGRSIYIESLEGCTKSEFQCVLNTDFIIVTFNKCVESIKYFVFVSFLIQMRVCSIYQLIFFLSILIELIIKDHGDTLLHHGILNLVALFLVLLLSEIVILLIIYIEQLIKRNKKKMLFYSLLVLFILIGAFIIKNKDNYYCVDWDKGLNNTYIDNNVTKYACYIEKPTKKCLITIFGPILDFSQNTFVDCKRRKKREKTLLLRKSNLKNHKNIKRVGYPISIGDKGEINGEPALYRDTLYKFMIKNLIDMDDKKELKKLKDNKIPEVVLDFTKNSYGELKIEVNYNKLLAAKRKMLENPKLNNILFIFMDNLSRVHFYRQYKKTSKFLEKFLTYEGYSNNINIEQKYHAFEFLKYHKFKQATLRNAMPMFSGVYYHTKNRMISIVKDLKNKGYITCNVQDVCHKELMYLNKLKKYTYVEFDHEFASPSCDPNIHSNGYNMDKGENSMIRWCLYGKDNIEHCTDYGKKFWKTYENNKRFLRIVNTYAHEYSGEKSKYADDAMYNFLKDLYETDQLKKTTLFMAADHGFILMGAYKILDFEDWKKEMQLPFLMIIEPDKKNQTYEQQYSEIQKNQQTFVTPFDIYYTLRFIIYGDKYKDPPLNGDPNDGECLFKYINARERTCNKYAGINKNSCVCKDFFRQ